MWKRNKSGCHLPFSICGVLACLWLIAGCAVGPDFVRPQPPAATQFTQGKEPTVTVSADGKAQHFEQGAKIAADWWRLFQSPQLDKVIKEAVAQNANLQSAQARLRQSQENLRAGYGVFFPRISGSFSPTRERFTAAQFWPPKLHYTLPAPISAWRPRPCFPAST